MASYNAPHLIDSFLTKHWDDFLCFLCDELDLDFHLDREQLEEAAEDIASHL